MWENGLYSVNYILNKHLLASSQAGSIGGTTRTGEFWEEESSFFTDLAQPQSKQDMTTLLKKVLSYVANIDKNNGLINISFKS